MERYKRKYFENIKDFFFPKYSMTDNPIIKEAVLSPIYLEEIEKYFNDVKNDIQKYNFKNLGGLCLYLTIKFRKFQIRFREDKTINNLNNFDECKVGINKSGCLSDRKGTIIIYVNENLFKIQNKDLINFYDIFVKNIIRIIGHELIHRHQNFLLETRKLRNYIMDHSKLKIKEYLSNRQEMMCRSWQILEEIRYVCCPENEIKTTLKNFKNLIRYSHTFYEYFRFFNSDREENKKLYNQLLKYIYQYYDGQEVE